MRFRKKIWEAANEKPKDDQRFTPIFRKPLSVYPKPESPRNKPAAEKKKWLCDPGNKRFAAGIVARIEVTLPEWCLQLLQHIITNTQHQPSLLFEHGHLCRATCNLFGM